MPRDVHGFVGEGAGTDTAAGSGGLSELGGGDVFTTV